MGIFCSKTSALLLLLGWRWGGVTTIKKLQLTNCSHHQLQISDCSSHPSSSMNQCCIIWNCVYGASPSDGPETNFSSFWDWLERAMLLFGLHFPSHFDFFTWCSVFYDACIETLWYKHFHRWQRLRQIIGPQCDSESRWKINGYHNQMLFNCQENISKRKHFFGYWKYLKIYLK